MKDYIKTKKNLKLTESLGAIELKHYSTVICFVENNVLTLNNGGYFSATTKKHMNEFMKYINQNISIFQKAKKWFVKIGDNIVDYENNMKINLE